MLSRYRGTLSQGASRSVNVAEGTPFRTLSAGQALEAFARVLDPQALGGTPPVSCRIQVDKTTLFDGPINSNSHLGATAAGSTQVSPGSNIEGLDRRRDVLVSGILNVSGTLSVTFIGPASAVDLVWELAG